MQARARFQTLAAVVGLALLAPAPDALAQEEPPQPALMAPPSAAAPAQLPPSEPIVTETPVGPPAPAAPEPKPRQRTEFKLPFPAERGGGVATGSAEVLDFEREKLAVLSGDVEIHYKDITLRGQRVEVDLETRVVTALGGITIDQGPQRLTGESATFDLETKTGTLTQASAYVDPDFYFSGEELKKTGDLTYEITKGTLTACKQEVPDWSFRLKRAKVEVEGYAHIRGATMRIKEVPILYLPYVVWPAKTERASGFLIPQPGYSDRQGASLSLAYFQTLGRSVDTTFFADLFSKSDYLGLGDELRWRPSEGTEGWFEGYAIKDPEGPDPGEWRWKVRLDTTTKDLPFGLRGVLAYRKYSDFDYLADFEREIDRNTVRSVLSKGFLTGNWGPQSLNLLIEDRETFINDTTIINQRRLPEVEYELRPTRLGKLPLFLDVSSSLAYFDVDRSALYDDGYGRFDVQPNLQVNVLKLPWLSASVNGGYRYTWYGNSLCATPTNPAETGEGFCDPQGPAFQEETLDRTLPVAGAELVGPSFSRIWNTKVGSFSKLKHVIEPRFNYAYLGDIDEDVTRRTPLFDEIDVLTSANLGRFVLINRVLGKPADESKGSAREIFSLKLTRLYSFDKEQPLQRVGTEETQFGPFDGELRFDPSEKTSLTAQVVYNTLASRVTQRSLSGAVGLFGSTLGVTWFTSYSPQTGETANDQARLWATLHLVPRRLTLESQIAYDIEREELQQQRYAVNYISQCYAFRVEASEFSTRQQRDFEYRFLLTLKNVGTFLDLNGRQSSAGAY